MADEVETMAEVRARANSHDGCPTDIFDRALTAHDARVRRDAAREALDGYADALNRNRSAAVWGWPEFVTDVREWAAYNYPEETP